MDQTGIKKAPILGLSPHFEPVHETVRDLVDAVQYVQKAEGGHFSHLCMEWNLHDESHYGLLVSVVTKPFTPEERDQLGNNPTSLARHGQAVTVGRIPFIVMESEDDTYDLLCEAAKLYQKELKKYFPVVKRNMSRA